MVEPPIPWRDWRRALRDDLGGSGAALDSITRFYSNGQSPMSSAEALDGLWRFHASLFDDKSVELAELLLLVAVASGAELVLASKLFQCSPADAAQDVIVFSKVAEKWPHGGAVADRSSDLTTQLVLVASTLLASIEQRQQGSAAIEDENNSLAECAMTWEEFAALPSCLDHSPLHKTTDGRALAQQLEQVVQQQAWALFEGGGGGCFIDSREALKQAIERLSRLQRPAAGYVEAIEVAAPIFECEGETGTGDYYLGQTAAPNPGTEPLEVEKDVYQVDHPLQALTPGGFESLAMSEQETAKYEAQVAALLADLNEIDTEIQLSVRATAVLGWQRTRRVAIADLVQSTTVEEWGRSIRKQINSLTRGESDRDRLLELLRLAAVHPTAVLHALVASALVATHHHELFVRLLWLCPLLSQWIETAKPVECPRSLLLQLLDDEVQRVVRQVGSSSPVADAFVFHFILVICGCHTTTATKSSRMVIIDSDEILIKMLWTEFRNPNDVVPLQAASRRLELVLQFVIRLRDSGQNCSISTILQSLDIAVELYSAPPASTSPRYDLALVELRDVALVLLRELVMLCPIEKIERWAATTSIEQADIPLQTLLGTILNRPANAELPAIGAPSDPASWNLRLQRYLWTLVWECEDSRFSCDRAGVSRTWLADELANASGTIISGAATAQIEVAKMLMVFGRRGFRRIVKMVETALLPPSRQADADSGTADSFPVHVHLVDYCARCWALVAFTSTDYDASLSMLENTVGLVSEAIEASAANPPALLQCLRVVGLAFRWLSSASHISPYCATIRSRLEISCVRILFVLSRQCSANPINQDESAFRTSVATVLASSRLFELDSVARFLRTQQS